MNLICYDIETLRNLFSVCFLDVETKQRKSFVLFDDIDELPALVTWLLTIRNNKATEHPIFLLGFNSLGFDAQVLEFILAKYKWWTKNSSTIQEVVADIYAEAQRVVNVPEEERYLHLIPENQLSIPQIDLFKQKHYDGMAKRGTSLKWVQFTMNYPTIEEMPIHHDTIVTKEQIPEILEYNWNDVESTADFFNKIKFETDLRVALSKQYNINLLNASEPRLAKDIFGKFLCEDMKIKYSELKKMRSFRHDIQIKKLILPYISFKDDILKAALQTFKDLEINPNKEIKWDKTFKYHGVEMVMGLGGLHGCCSPGIFVADDEYIIHDVDVTSFYPNLAIVNGIKPQHLGESFNKIYNNIFEERKKIPKKDPINYVYKIILNSTYGLSNEKNSYLYDPIFTFSITVNGQLSLLMLIEMMIAAVPSLQLLQANTDGVTIKYKKSDLKKIDAVCEEWEKITKLSLEENFYSKMVIKDVNNYIAIPTIGDPKKKGIFETNIEYHKNPSFIIVQKALEAYFVKGVDYREYIRKNENIYDFLGAVKSNVGFKLVWHDLSKGEHVEKIQQKVTRFYISHGGGKFVKHFKDGRRIGVLTDWRVTPLNRVIETNALAYPIDYNFYIKECEKIASWVEGNKQQLKLF